MKDLSKLLLLKSHREHALARSWIVGEVGMHVRLIDDADMLQAVLRSESFDLVLLDQRESDDDLLSTIEALRQHQAGCKLLVVSDGVALPQVIQAMRYGVRDIFQPPFNLHAVLQRVETDLRGAAAERGEAALAERWADLAACLGQPAAHAAPKTAARSKGAPEKAPPGDGAETAQLRRDLDRAVREAADLRRQLERAHAAAQTARPAAAESAAAASPAEADARFAALRKELEALREQKAEWERARKAPRPDAEAGPLKAALEAATARIKTLEATRKPAGAPEAALPKDVAALQREIEARVSNAAQLQEHLAAAMLAQAESAKELARLGGVEARCQRAESQLAAAKAEAAAAAEKAASEEKARKALEKTLRQRDGELADKAKGLAEAVARAATAQSDATKARQGFEKAQAEVARERSEMTAERERVARLQGEAQALAAAAAKREAETAAVLQAETATLEKQRAALAAERAELEKRGAALARLDGELTALGRKFESRAAELGAGEARLAEAMARIEAETASLAKARGALDKRSEGLEKTRTAIRDELQRLAERV